MKFDVWQWVLGYYKLQNISCEEILHIVRVGESTDFQTHNRKLPANMAEYIKKVTLVDTRRINDINEITLWNQPRYLTPPTFALGHEITHAKARFKSNFSALSLLKLWGVMNVKNLTAFYDRHLAALTNNFGLVPFPPPMCALKLSRNVHGFWDKIL